MENATSSTSLSAPCTLSPEAKSLKPQASSHKPESQSLSIAHVQMMGFAFSNLHSMHHDPCLIPHLL
jgi:hypothetical protein